MTFFRDENGQGMVEYALIIGLIAVVLIVVIIILRSRIQGSMGNAANVIKLARYSLSYENNCYDKNYSDKTNDKSVLYHALSIFISEECHEFFLLL